MAVKCAWVRFMACGLFGMAMLAWSSAAKANLIVNGDFSSGDTGFSSDYTFETTNTAAGQYGVATDPHTFNTNLMSLGDHTTGTGNMMIVNGSGTTGAVVWDETVTVTSGTSYNFGAFVADADKVPDPSPPVLEFLINGVQIGSDLTVPGTTNDWQDFTYAWSSGASTSAQIQIVDLNTVALGNDFVLDDITFDVPTSVPLPSAAYPGLAALTAVGLIGWSRSRHVSNA